MKSMHEQSRCCPNIGKRARAFENNRRIAERIVKRYQASNVTFRATQVISATLRLLRQLRKHALIGVLRETQGPSSILSSLAFSEEMRPARYTGDKRSLSGWMLAEKGSANRHN